MSNSVYPTLPGLTHGQVRAVLPPPVQIRTTPARREYRARDATLPRYGYTLPYAFLRSRAALAELQTLVGFYNQHGGPFDTFLYLDRDDSTAALAPFGTGNGTATAFQALRPWGGFSEPVDAFVGTPTVYINGSATTAFTVAAGSGVITFNTAPSNGAVLTWSGSFYRRCRFDQDKLEATQFLRQLWEAKRVQLMSARA
jgi:uncharacterized protein (TIGR02217 family)